MATTTTARKPDLIHLHDYVRSYDAYDVGRWDSYYEGVVVGTAIVEGCPRYVIRTTKLVYDGRIDENRPAYVYPPVNGVRAITGSACRGVHLLDGGDEGRGQQPGTDDPISAEGVVREHALVVRHEDLNERLMERVCSTCAHPGPDCLTCTHRDVRAKIAGPCVGCKLKPNGCAECPVNEADEGPLAECSTVGEVVEKYFSGPGSFAESESAPDPCDGCEHSFGICVDCDRT